MRSTPSGLWVHDRDRGPLARQLPGDAETDEATTDDDYLLLGAKRA
jgi:hypothetical protein